MYNWIIWILWK